VKINLDLPSPIARISSPLATRKGVELWIKREDLIHPQLSGNKWRKLEHNLLEMKRQGKKGLLTFGGAYSNHIYATAAAGHYLSFPTIGIIRGEAHTPLNPTLTYATEAGMQLHYVSRTAYRDPAQLAKDFTTKFPDYYLLPEGGTNIHALPGCAAIINEVEQQFPEIPDYICLSCGTGGTLAGLITGLQGRSQLLGFSALKGDFHTTAIRHLLAAAHQPDYANWTIRTDYHFGGYAKTKPMLTDFIQKIKKEHQIPLERIYTAKMLYGVLELIKKGYFKEESRILVIHTGGMQGASKE